ncbi:hypothetical protein EUX98_g1474 [Antrodiella citrinella]|uniref:Uncharacterized protein n=1 Tax=Antrodiella citrinella TaxID=2447956 RepID=A0A4S4N2X8_9APHY|nr:hypothetical protein EUX98_g1474 [Antrodiella citrinella]
MSAAFGAKVIIMPKWNTEEAMKLIKLENIQTAGGYEDRFDYDVVTY